MQPIKHLINLIQKLLERISIRERLLFCVIFLSITPVLIVCSIAGGRFEKAVTDKTARYSLAELAQAAVNIQLKLAEYETISLQLFVNNDFITSLENYSDIGNNLIPGIRKAVESYFNEYMNNNGDLFGFIFFPDSEKPNPIIVTKDFQNDFTTLGENFKGTSVYNSILKADGGIVWSATLKVSRSNFLILGRLIKRISNGKPLGILAIIIDEDKIDQLANLSIYNDLNNSLNGIDNYSLVINSNGEIVSSPFKEDIGQSASELIENIGLRKSVSSTGHENKIDQGSFFTTVNDQRSLVTFKAVRSKVGKAGKGNWYLVNLAPASFLYKERQVVMLVTIALCFVFGLLGVWVSFSVTNIIYRKQRLKIRRHKRLKSKGI